MQKKSSPEHEHHNISHTSSRLDYYDYDAY